MGEQLTDLIGTALNALTGDRGAADSVSQDAELSRALAEANDLLMQASNARNAALAHLSENPDDVAEAQEAVEFAQRTVRELQAARNGGSSGGRRPDVTQMLNQLGGVVQHAQNNVGSHEAGSPSGATRKILIHNPVDAKNDANKRPQAASPNVQAAVRRALGIREPEPEEDDSRQQRRGGVFGAVGSTVAGGWRRMRDDDGVVGVAARTVDGTVRTVGRGVQFVASGEAGRSAGTAADITGDGARAIMRGDREASDREAQRFGRGMRNVLRDDLGIDAGVAQTVGRATTEVAQTGGRLAASGVEVVRETAGRSQRMVDRGVLEARLFFPVNGLNDDQWKNVRGASGRKLDLDGDGKVEVSEIRWHLNQVGVIRSEHIGNGDANITGAELTALLRRLPNMPTR